MAGKVTYRLKRPTLIGFAFAMGLDPFAAYGDEAAYQEILTQVEAKLIECKPGVKTYWSGGDELLNLMRSGETVASMAWDTGGWKLNEDNPDITTVAPTSGALGWIDTFVLPAKGQADQAAYDWINFVMQPEIAAMITDAAGNFTASAGCRRARQRRAQGPLPGELPAGSHRQHQVVSAGARRSRSHRRRRPRPGPGRQLIRSDTTSAASAPLAGAAPIRQDLPARP